MKLKTITACLIILALGIYGTYKLTKRHYMANSGYSILLHSKTINGKDVNSLIDKDKPLLVNFWGTWCPDCVGELAEIEKLSKNKNLTLITVAQNSGSNEKIKEFMKKKGVNFIVVNDKGDKIVNAYKIFSYPTTYYYSPSRNKTVLKRSGSLKYEEYLFFADFVNKY